MSSRRLLRTVLPAAALALAVFGVSAWALHASRGSAPAPAPAAASEIPPVAQTSIQQVAQAQAAIAERPRDDRALAALADSSLQLVRETGDPTWYVKAEEAAERALSVNP